jgi:tetratricopeptide (TPR) repeat protein
MMLNGEYGAVKTGDKTLPDFDRARQLFVQASTKGVCDAFFHLGLMSQYHLGNHQDVDDFRQHALDFYQQAADAGNLKALLMLGNLHASADPTAAVSFWTKAADASTSINVSARSLALHNLGNVAFLGRGSSQPDYIAAIAYWQKAVDSNPDNVYAWLQLGTMFYDGIGMTRPDFDKASECYRQIISNRSTDSSLDDIKYIASALNDACQLHITGPIAVPATPKRQNRRNSLSIDEKQLMSKIDKNNDEAAQQDAIRSRWSFVEDFNVLVGLGVRREVLIAASTRLAPQKRRMPAQGDMCSIM